jgi:hypothetical protein
MKTVRRISLPATGYAHGSYAVIGSVAGLVRDVVKDMYLAAVQVYTRLFCVEREIPSAISLRARLDVVPRAPSHERHRLSLGKRALIEASSVVCTWHGDVVLRNGAIIGIGSVVIGPVRFGENSACSQHCFICGQSHHYEDITKNFLKQGFKAEEVIIQHDVWIGSNSVVLCGVKIGNNSVIGGGSVVSEDIPPYCLAVGNPAKVIKKYDFKAARWVRL